jgi:predicted phage-related endonuclease
VSGEDAGPPAVERRPIKSREEWLAWRMADVTATDAPALFGAHPYGRSALSVWAEKSGLLEAMADNPVFRRGRWAEAAVAEMLGDERPSWRVARPRVYLTDRLARIGASLDIEAIDPDRPGVGVVEAKTVTRNVFEREWTRGPPVGFQIQALIGAMLRGASWLAVATLIMDPYGGWEPAIFDLERHEAAEARIRAGVVKFWTDFEAGLMPAVNPESDAETVAAMFPKAEIKEPPLDLADDPDLCDALAVRAVHKRLIAESEKNVERIETELKARMGPHARAIAPGFRISWKNEPRKEYSVAASEPRVLRINPTREG